MLSLDRNLINTNISSFISALCLMFGSYYCFNIHYPSELASTLEFLQRCFFSINPEKGTKVENKNSKRRLTVNPRVITLIQELSDHEWREGGFTENFSRSQYFCRYCEIKRSEFESDPNACGPPRTPATEKMSDSEQTFLEDAVSEVLPELPAATKSILIEHLQSIGVETYDDLQFIEEADLMTALRPVQARKLLSIWKRKYQTPENSSSSSSVNASPAQSLSLLSVSPRSSSSSSSTSPGLDTQWDDNFEIPWTKFPDDLMHALERGKGQAQN
ncbi:hypothetical protein WMY93_020104 [Mugilogobius chulae]|uniref:Uncharacterized protein n=1 Tax=Mugilogobius chulae TaxID=88201 RepID=A0AAW0NGE2_9GOBI